MSNEIEAAAGGAFGGFLRFRRRVEHAVAPGTPCANCATPLMGPWCYQCGQLGEDFHRSIWKLIGEAFEGLLHFDGRVWRTLPDLFIRPARLTRAYLDGHRAPQIPPFRLFLVVLVVVFFAGSLDRGATFGSLTSSADRRGAGGLTGGLEHMTPEARAKMKAMIENGTVTVYERSPGHGTTIGSVTSPAGATAKASVTRAPERLTPETWLKARMAQVLDDPRRFSLILESWAERFAFLTLPMAAVLISVTFVFQRRFFIFDHTIFSLHSLSAVGLMFAGVEALSPLIGDWANLILWGAPIHLFAHMRGVYGTSVIGTLARMAFLFMGSAVLGALIFMGLLLVGLNGMAA